ncbi:MAG: DUF5107 domain-containing protein, partial [Saprospiraceae bacterium]|nr:DUF5107 domain-containing protein [Saprospiraceae bacterium]
MYFRALALSLIFCYHVALPAQTARISEEEMPFPTYGFGDPNPVAKVDVNYPYFHFDGYTNQATVQSWKVVVLENPYLKVYVAPEIGGKVLGAFIKSTGKDFVYFNPVIKFRNIAARGPWTSGGIEFNFGSYGHTVNTATPVDYITRTNSDGSVSCFVGAHNRTGHTVWQVEVRVPADKAWFETNGNWHNESDLPVLSYHWSNAAFDVAEDLRVTYPGTAEIFHDGLPGPYPINKEGVDLSFYRNNNFGGSHSYHVLGKATDFYGAYYPSDNWGMVHWSPFSDKLGKKIWYWSLARDGAIWTDLLTDPDKGKGQYTELQSGLGYNQTGPSHSPFIVQELAAQGTEHFREKWYPITGLEGLTFANTVGALFIQCTGGKLIVEFCPVRPGNFPVVIEVSGKKVMDETLQFTPLQTQRWTFVAEDDHYSIDIDNHSLYYSPAQEEEKKLSRPLDGIRSSAAYATYLWGLQQLRAKDYYSARMTLEKSLEQDSTLVPAMNALAELHLKQMRYAESKRWVMKALAWNTYDGSANYLFGLLAVNAGNQYDALDGFSVAAKDPAYTLAANVQLAKVHYRRGEYDQALAFAEKAMRYDALDATARWLDAKAWHRLGDDKKAVAVLENLLDDLPLFHLARQELQLIAPDNVEAGRLSAVVTNEFISDTYLEMACRYADLGERKEAIRIASPYINDPMVALHLDAWSRESGIVTDKYLQGVLGGQAELVFPYRPESAIELDRLLLTNDHWKLHYYRALIAWYMDDPEVAQRHFDACGAAPDFAGFYLSRFEFDETRQGGALSDLQRAFTLSPDWRGYSAQIEYYLNHHQPVEALKWAEQAELKFPKDFRLTTPIVQALLMNGQYQRSFDLLQKTTILPFEGARYGKGLWDQATLMLGLQAMQSGKYSQAVNWAAKALEWPENLGIGKPHDPDERLAQFLQYRSLAAQGNNQARSLAKSIYDRTNQSPERLSPSDLLGWKAGQEFGWTLDKSWYDALEAQKETNPLAGWMEA